MTGPSFAFVPVLGHELHVTTWGNPSTPALVMWHGLARTGRDFDEIAAALSDAYFVLCPDTIGRGLSSWSDRPEAEYAIAHYADIAAALLDHFNIDQANWLGTSMGGMIGMWMASGNHADRLSALIINDIGPEVPQAAIDRILEYSQSQPRFAAMAEAKAWFRAAYAPFGPASDAYWTRMARSSVRRCADGGFTTHFDPNITIQFTASPHELTTWDRFEKIAIPMHVIRGAMSDLLLPGTVEKMAAANPMLTSSVVANAGHAPTLSGAQDIDFLRATLRRLNGAG